MAKKTIRISEADLHRIISETVKETLLNEGFFGNLFGKKKQQHAVPQRQESPMEARKRANTKPDGRIATDNDPIEERICVNGTMSGTGDVLYFGKKGSLPWFYQSYPDANGKREGFYHMVKNKDYGAKFSQIMYFRPAWSRGGGMTITFWKTLNNQELQRVQQIMANETFENGITPFVQKIDSVLLKQNQ